MLWSGSKRSGYFAKILQFFAYVNAHLAPNLTTILINIFENNSVLSEESLIYFYIKPPTLSCFLLSFFRCKNFNATSYFRFLGYVCITPFSTSSIQKEVILFLQIWKLMNPKSCIANEQGALFSLARWSLSWLLFSKAFFLPWTLQIEYYTDWVH